MQIFEDTFGGGWTPITGCTRARIVWAVRQGTATAMNYQTIREPFCGTGAGNGVQGRALWEIVNNMDREERRALLEQRRSAVAHQLRRLAIELTDLDRQLDDIEQSRVEARHPPTGPR
jgi:hypothetical protein